MKKILIFFLVINSCSYPEMVRNELVYENTFENTNLDKIDGGGLSTFNNTTVLGDFNNDGFILFLDDIGEHDYVSVAFDIYIHGSWDGNSNGFDIDDQADKWTMELSPDMNLYKDPASNSFTTTFSNSTCWPNYCLRQSYPETFPYENNPKKGAFMVDLDSKCLNNFFGGPTTLYQIEKVFKSSGNNIVLRFYDELYQPNAIDKNGNPQNKCDESWSIDNLRVRMINYE